MIFDVTRYKTQSQTNRHPPSTVIAATDNHFLPPSDDDDDNDADPAELMGNCNGGGENKGKGGHRRRYRDENKIQGPCSLYREQKENDDDGHDFGNDDCN